MALWGSVPSFARCLVCGRSKHEARRAGTKLEGHHAVAKRKLKEVARARGLNLIAVVWDLRNRVFVCGSPCHPDHTSAKRRIRLADLPSHVLVFARELGLMWWVEREYP